MKEGVNINFNGTIINNGGTINGDINHPTYHFGQPSAADRRKNALQLVETRISEEARQEKPDLRKLFMPLVAAIRVNLVSNTMSVDEFNTKYGTSISRTTFADYFPKAIDRSRIAETESAATEEELCTILGK